MNTRAIKGARAAGPTTKTQQDVTNREFPREELKYATYEDFPILSTKNLCGDKMDQESMTSFIHNTLRAKPLVHYWELSLGNLPDNTRWQTIIPKRDIQKSDKKDIAKEATMWLAENGKAAGIRISVYNGLEVAISDSKMKGEPAVTIGWRPL